jgi:glucose-1-phosphate cytidylyltransferase
MNSAVNEFDQVPVVVLCGGRGVIFNEQHAQRQNKALVEVHGQPLFLWVLRHYALHGASDFVLATGLQGDQFGPALESAGATAAGDGRYTLSLGGRDCAVRLVPTPDDAPTAARLLACRPYLANAARFAMTYSDTLSDIDLGAEMRFHKQQNLVATLLAATYPVRFRVLGMRQGESLVRAFAPRPVIESAAINGGYYIFTQALWEERFGVTAGGALEDKPLEALASAGQLAAWEGKGRWQHCDAERDLAALDKVAAALEEQLSA